MRSYRLLILAVTFLTLSAGSAFAGNGAPNDQKLLFNLQVIAYDGDNCPSGDFTGSNTHRIAVKADVNDDPRGLLSDLIRQNDIFLIPGEFQVVDGNACIDGTATFQLPPNPCAGVDSTVDDVCSVDDPQFQVYEVYARLVGKPGTSVNVTTCATDELTDDGGIDDIIVCSTENYMETRYKGKGSQPYFNNVSKELLTICLDTTDDGNLDGRCDVRLALFNSTLEDYFWNWNTEGKAHAQLRFYAVPD